MSHTHAAPSQPDARRTHHAARHSQYLKVWIDPLDWMIDAFFLLDTLLNFRTVHMIQETNELVTSTKLICAPPPARTNRVLPHADKFASVVAPGACARSFAHPPPPLVPHAAERYMRSYFAPDIIGALPWDLTQARGLKILYLLRIFTLRKPIARETGKSVNVRRVLNILLYFLIIAHWVGCAWWAIGALETDHAIANGASISTYKASWLQRIPMTKWNSRLAYPLTKDSDFAMQYWSSLYWSFTALVKVPWIAPNTILEKAFASAVVMVGAIFFASLLGAIVSAIAAVDRSGAQRRDKMTLMHNFCTSRRLDPSIKGGMTRCAHARPPSRTPAPQRMACGPSPDPLHPCPRARSPHIPLTSSN